MVLLGEDTPASSSQSVVDGNLLTSIPRRNDLVSARQASEFGSEGEEEKGRFQEGLLRGKLEGGGGGGG